MSKFKNKYRIESARMRNWDYGWAGKYFITIVTKFMVHYFGRVENGQMILNEIGRIVHDEWAKTSQIRPDMNITLDEFCIMPNHFHAIIIIGCNQYNRPDPDTGSGDAMHHVSSTEATNGSADDISDIPEKQTAKNKFGPQRKNLSSTIGGFKRAVTKRIHPITPEFEWHPRFHDHIIRNDNEYWAIKTYIRNNPKNWKDDTYFK